MEEAYDVAIRIVYEPAPDLVACELAPMRRVVFASPEYLERNGVPKTPQDLKYHNCSHYTPFGTPDVRHFKGPDGDVSVPVTGARCASTTTKNCRR